MFVWSDIVVYCCWMLPLSLRYAPSHAWRLVSVRVCPPVRAFVCECVCVRVLWPDHFGLFFFLAFLRMEMSTIAYFGLEVFHHGGGADAASCVPCFERACALHDMQPTFETRSFLHIRFCIQPPTTDITSSLQSHTVFHSINFCPPP